MEFIENRLYVNRNLQPGIAYVINDYYIDYPIEIRLLNKIDYSRFVTRNGLYMGKSVKSQYDILADIPLYEYKNEHLINDVFNLSYYHSKRMTYVSDNGISYDNKNCAINTISVHQLNRIKDKLERLNHCLDDIPQL